MPNKSTADKHNQVRSPSQARQGGCGKTMRARKYLGDELSARNRQGRRRPSGSCPCSPCRDTLQRRSCRSGSGAPMPPSKHGFLQLNGAIRRTTAGLRPWNRLASRCASFLSELGQRRPPPAPAGVPPVPHVQPHERGRRSSRGRCRRQGTSSRPVRRAKTEGRSVATLSPRAPSPAAGPRRASP